MESPPSTSFNQQVSHPQNSPVPSVEYSGLSSIELPSANDLTPKTAAPGSPMEKTKASAVRFSEPQTHDSPSTECSNALPRTSEVGHSAAVQRSVTSPATRTTPPSTQPLTTRKTMLNRPSPVAILCPSGSIKDEELMSIYIATLKEDGGVYREALDAYQEMKDVPMDDDDEKDPEDEDQKPQGIVNRRAPLNPLASPRLGKYRKKQVQQKSPKVQDPALKNTPLIGRLVMTITSTAVLLFVFMQSLAYNKVYTSRPHPTVLLDSGIGKFHATFKDNGMLGPEPQTLWDLGGLNIDRIRNNGEAFRLFWAMWMHSGWIHIAFNILSQVQYFFMFEPDWGFWKCLIIFWVSGITGNLVSGCANPCSTTVGSSGGLFGLMAAIVPFCIEFWTTIPRPECILGFSLIVVVISLLTGFTQSTDNWAHIGGFAGGICFGLGTVSSLTACRHCCPDDAPPKPPTKGTTAENMVVVMVNSDGVAKKKVVKRAKFTRVMLNKLEKNHWKCGKREWTVRIIMFSILIAIWITCFVLIFVNYDYQPFGQVTYSGITACCCCYNPTMKHYWRCLPCKYNLGSGKTWGDTCATSFSQSRTFNLKSQYKDKSLFEALGFERLGIETLLTDTLPLPSSMRSGPTVEVSSSSLSDIDSDSSLFNTTLSHAIPFADLFPSISRKQGSATDIIRLSQSSTITNFSEYFDGPLTKKDEEWLHYQEYRFRQRTLFFQDIVRRFLV